MLRGVKGIGFREFTDRDVVRHPLVQSIIRAYERHAPTRSAEVGPSGEGGEAGAPTEEPASE